MRWYLKKKPCKTVFGQQENAAEMFVVQMTPSRFGDTVKGDKMDHFYSYLTALILLVTAGFIIWMGSKPIDGTIIGLGLLFVFIGLTVLFAYSRIAAIGGLLIIAGVITLILKRKEIIPKWEVKQVEPLMVASVLAMMVGFFMVLPNTPSEQPTPPITEAGFMFTPSVLRPGEGFRLSTGEEFHVQQVNQDGSVNLFIKSRDIILEKIPKESNER